MIASESNFKKGYKLLRTGCASNNNLDVGQFLEALETMRDFYKRQEPDIFKEAVSLTGISMKYLPRVTLNKRDAS